MTTSLGSELRSRREAVGLTQGAVAERLGVKRPTLSQWESDRHRPSVEHLNRLDEIYNARGALVGLVGEEPAPRMVVAEVFREVADALVASLVRGDDGEPLGWSHHLHDTTPTPLSTAFVLHTLQMLDDTRVDAHALAQRLEQRRTEEGWSNRPGQASRPEVTAVVLGVMARLGHVADVDGELAKLERSIDEFAMTRPYIIAVVLECLVALRPEGRFTDQLTAVLLNSRTRTPAGVLWTFDATADADLVQPSLAHTARATAVLRMVRSKVHRSEIDDAIGTATDWMIDPGMPDDGITEILRRDPTDRAGDVPIQHFTSAWTIRALAGVGHVAPARLQSAADALGECYTARHGLWTWRSDGSLPSWMTHDAVAALRFLALNSTTPINTSR